jgi:hypothetical protein
MLTAGLVYLVNLVGFITTLANGTLIAIKGRHVLQGLWGGEGGAYRHPFTVCLACMHTHMTRSAV